MSFKDTWRWPGMVIVLLVGFATFIHGVNDLTIWADEAWTIYASDPAISLAETYDRVVVDIHPPMFFLELHLWRELTGTSLFEMRYFSILLMMVTLALLYRLGRSMFSPAAGILAAAFVALSDLERIFAQEVRHYPQQQLVVVLVMFAYWRFWQRPTRRRGIVLALAGAAVLWSYYWGGFVLLGLACHAVVTRPKSWRVVTVVFGAMGVLYIPWLRPLYDQYAALDNGLNYSLPNNWESAITLGRQMMGMPPELWLALVLAGIPRALRVDGEPHHWRPSAVTLLPTVVIGVVVIATVILNIFFPSMFTRSLAIIIPSIALLIGHTLAQLRWPEGGLVVIMAGIAAVTLTSAAPVIRAVWDDVGVYLGQHITEDDVLLLEMNYAERKELEELTLRFYLDQTNPRIRAVSTGKQRGKAPGKFQAFLDEQLAGEDGVWVAKLGWWYYDLREDLCARGFVETAPLMTWPKFGAQPIEVVRFDRPPTDDPLATFGDTMQLMRASVGTGDDFVTANLLWTPAAASERNYTVSVFLLDANGGLVTQHDSYPLEGRSPTSAWEAGGFYFDSHVLALDHVSPGTYRVGLQVYAFTDETFLTIEQIPMADCSEDCMYLMLDTIQIGD